MVRRTRNDWIPELWVSLLSYGVALLIVAIVDLQHGLNSHVHVLGAVALSLLIPVAVKVLGAPNCFWVSVLACGLGIVSGLGVYLMGSFLDGPLFYFGAYVTTLSFFHFSEYFTTALWNPHRLSLDSFILNHSRAYHIAAVASWLEYGLETWLCPSLKLFTWISRIGLVCVVVGQFLRQLAMFTTRSNFSHLIAYEKEDEHELVTWGVYSLSRHPSYVGWFYWSIGTQLMLCNPVCTLAYAAASWSFFRERIEEEEATLIHFFGRKYEDYQTRVGTGLPFIRGFRLRA